MYKIINIVIKATIYIVAFIKGEIFMDFINKVKVALVDTGIDINHEYLKNNIIGYLTYIQKCPVSS